MIVDHNNVDETNRLTANAGIDSSGLADPMTLEEVEGGRSSTGFDKA